jgi:hypothetical protein
MNNAGWTWYIFISYPSCKEHTRTARKIRNYIKTKIHMNHTEVLSFFLIKIKLFKSIETENYTKI